MQELKVLSDTELAGLQTGIRERRKSLATVQGKKESEQWVIRLFDYLQNSGYRLPEGDKKRMAGVYADQLKDAIIVYGYEQVSYCVREWIKEDTYKAFPNSGMILKKVHELCGNPLAEIARREFESGIEHMKQRDHEKLMSQFTPEELQRIYEKHGGVK